ncbi:Hypothetical protein D9617_4g003370 [Elsinoe fawcettii]|nr:Hypothetical protein D9617_4g003370 [Elsinoe fawcettii]
MRVSILSLLTLTFSISTALPLSGNHETNAPESLQRPRPKLRPTTTTSKWTLPTTGPDDIPYPQPTFIRRSEAKRHKPKPKPKTTTSQGSNLPTTGPDDISFSQPSFTDRPKLTKKPTLPTTGPNDIPFPQPSFTDDVYPMPSFSKRQEEVEQYNEKLNIKPVTREWSLPTTGPEDVAYPMPTFARRFS